MPAGRAFRRLTQHAATEPPAVLCNGSILGSLRCHRQNHHALLACFAATSSKLLPLLHRISPLLLERASLPAVIAEQNMSPLLPLLFAENIEPQPIEDLVQVSPYIR